MTPSEGRVRVQKILYNAAPHRVAEFLGQLITEAVSEEREAIAAFVEPLSPLDYRPQEIAAAIRARSDDA